MSRLQQMQIFVAVAEEQGFAAAARRMQLSPPVITRAIAGLEEHLGVKLFGRTTRTVRVTEAGERYLEDVRRILADIQTAEDTASGVNARPSGSLAVTAPVLFGRKYVLPGIIEYLDMYPETRVDTLFLDRSVDLLEEGLDVGIRIGELPDSSMRALKVGAVRHRLVASPAYIQRHGVPETPDDLNIHTMIGSSAGNFGAGWKFRYPDGERSIRIEPRLTVITNDAAISAAVEGFGIARLLSYQIADEIDSGKLVTLLEYFEAPQQPVHIVHRSGPRSPAKVRAFIDLMSERLRADKALNPGGS